MNSHKKPLGSFYIVAIAFFILIALILTIDKSIIFNYIFKDISKENKEILKYLPALSVCFPTALLTFTNRLLDDKTNKLIQCFYSGIIGSSLAFIFSFIIGINSFSGHSSSNYIFYSFILITILYGLIPILNKNETSFWKNRVVIGILILFSLLLATFYLMKLNLLSILNIEISSLAQIIANFLTCILLIVPFIDFIVSNKNLKKQIQDESNINELNIVINRLNIKVTNLENQINDLNSISTNLKGVEKQLQKLSNKPNKKSKHKPKHNK